MSQLRVSSIANIAGSSAITINANGLSTESAKPMFHANMNGGSYGGGTVIPFNMVTLNVGGYYSSSSYRFTAPVAGKYYFYTTMLSSNDAGAIDFRFYKNGTTIVGAGYTGGFTGYKQTNSMLLIDLALNDYIDIRAFGTDSIHGDSPHNSFGGWLVG
jgi:hypothetical protein